MNKTGSNYTAIQDLRTPHADAKYIELDDVKPDSLPGWLNSYYNTNLMNVNTGFDNSKITQRVLSQLTHP